MPNNFMSYRDAYDDIIDGKTVVKQDHDDTGLEQLDSIINTQNNPDNTQKELTQFDQTPFQDTFDAQSITSNQQVVLRFTQNLSEQFMSTLRYLFKIGSIMVRTPGVTKQRYDKFQQTFNKLKSLIEAAKNTRFH